MSGKTGIEWTDRTWNPVVGCTKVSQGCKHCYAKTVHDMRHKAFHEGKDIKAKQYAEPFETVQLMADRLGWPISLRKPSRIFVNSVSDLFHEDVPDQFIDRVFVTMARSSRHTYQILTKRPARMRGYIAGMESLYPQQRSRRLHRSSVADHPLDAVRNAEPHSVGDLAWPLPNVQLGVSVENQEAADERIPLLHQTAAAVRYLSCEPLIGPVDLTKIGRFRNEDLSALEECVGFINRPRIDWVIVGGESGSSKQNPRPMHPDWARSIRDQCVTAGVPFLFKQWGDWCRWSPGDTGQVRHVSARDGKSGFAPGYVDGERHVRADTVPMSRVGKKRAGRELDGRTWDEFPEVRS